MREKSLKFIKQTLIYSLGIGLFGCAKIYRRPTSLVYPKAKSEYVYPSNYGYYQIPTNQTLNTKPQNANYQPIQQQNYTQLEPIKNINTEPTEKIQTSALIPQQKQDIVKPVIEEKPKEEIILEEVIYVPSALQTTPVDEIEILSESKVSSDELIKIQSSETKPETNESVSPFVDQTTNTITIKPEDTRQNISIKKQEDKTKSEPKSDIKLSQKATPQENKKTELKIETKPEKISETKEIKKPKKIKVYNGDTLYSIAQKNNIKVYELADYNKLQAPFVLKPGQTIEIPGNEPIKPVKTAEIITNLNNAKTFIEEPKKDFITVKKGDTIYSIAKQNNVPLKDIILRNNLKAPYTLSIGEKIYIPNTAFHIVKAQDTAYSISRKYNVNLNSLVKLNKLTEPYTLSIGQKILLPATNIDVVQKQIKYIVKDKDTAKTVQPFEKEEIKEVAKVRVAQKQKIEEKPKQIQNEIEIEKQEKIKSIIAKPEPLTSKRFLWPLNGKVISSYGIKNNGKRNDGINISAKMGSPVVAAENGIVAYAGNELKGLGNLIIIKHDKDYMTIYAHNETILVRIGDNVKRGDNIATVGKTGRVTTPQLHFEIRNKTKSIDPSDVLERK